MSPKERHDVAGGAGVQGWGEDLERINRLHKAEMQPSVNSSDFCADPKRIWIELTVTGHQATSHIKKRA